MQKLIVKEETTLLDLLTGAGYTRTKAKHLLARGTTAVDGRICKRGDQPLAAGETVSIKSAREMQEEARVSPVPIVHEDEAIVVIIKPAGLLSIATDKEKRRTAYYLLNNFLKERAAAPGERIFVVHRLDRDTSGLLVFAKSEEVKRTMQAQWPQAVKRYAALVEGVPREKSGEISSRLKESKALRVHTVRGREEGKPAVTRYQVVKAGPGYALLAVTLTTGRKNQIRVHLADLGHPVAGDKKYGATTDPIGRLALHAETLAFSHPLTGERCEFTAPVPGKFYQPFPRAAGPDGPAAGAAQQHQGGTTMAKSQDSKKETKKAPAKTQKEKKAAKKAKKEEKGRG